MRQVCLVGATSHVAKNLIDWNRRNLRWNLQLFARRPAAVEEFLSSGGSGGVSSCLPIEALSEKTTADAIINCVGFGTPGSVRDAGPDLFRITETIDNRILSLLGGKHPVKYINLSSGAVYGTGMDRPVERGFISHIGLSPLAETENYRITKIYQEAKHRAFATDSIVDLRLFNFFSRFIDPTGGYLMTDILQALRTKTPLVTSEQEIFRDYIAPDDFAVLVDLILEAPVFNAALDVYSAGAISKSVLLANLTREFGLEVQVRSGGAVSPTGLKQVYYSCDHGAEAVVGFKPKWTSWEGIALELVALGFSREEQGA